MKTVLMFAKAPEPGRVKTRLARSIGDDAAAALHDAFLRDLCADLARALGDSARRVLLYAGDPEHPAFVFAREHGWLLHPQPSGDLGDRLTEASRWAFEDEGAERVAMIGSDAPTLSARHLQAAWAALDTDGGGGGHDVSLVPSGDGGYVLLATRAHRPELYGHGVWSSHRTLGATLQAADDASVRLFDFWYDVDVIEDLELLRDHLVLHLARPGGREYGYTIHTLRELEARGVLPLPSIETP
jgi:hypothetical protein